MNWNYSIKLLMWCALLLAMPVRATVCDTIEQCIEKIPYLDDRNYGWGTVDNKVKERLVSFDSKALKQLAELSGQSNVNRRTVAGNIISEMVDLEESDFEVIRQVILNNVAAHPQGYGGSAYRALARIGGQRATRFLVSELKRADSASGPLSNAFYLIGSPALPYLTEGLTCNKGCEGIGYSNYTNVFTGFKEHLKLTDDNEAWQLLNLAKDKNNHKHASKAAILSLGYITSNKDIAKQVYLLGEKQPFFAEVALTTLIEMKSHWAAGLLVDKISAAAIKNDAYTISLSLRDLAKMGHKGAKVGDRLVPYLQSDSWETRIHVALALGYIGHHASVNDLHTLSQNKQDWQQVYAGVKALTMLGDISSIPHIKTVAENHWFTPLRQFAQQSLAILQSAKTTKVNPEKFDFFDYTDIRLKDHECKGDSYKKFDESVSVKMYRDESNNNLDAYQYRDPLCATNDFDGAGEDFCNKDVSMFTPNLVAQYKGDWLSGTNRGEWGGELLLFSDTQKAKLLIEDNIEDIYVIGQHAYITAGVAHMSSNRGIIYQLSKSNENYSHKRYYRLPGAPRTSWKISKDDILINTISGAVIFNAKKGLKMADCAAKG